jgi:predicted GH43/DUF377 family glycosyl hydrolase
MKPNLSTQITAFAFGLILLLCGCTAEMDPTSSSALSPTPWAFQDFEKVDSLNPILLSSTDLAFTCPITANEVQWESRNVLNPAAVVKDGRVHLFYRAQDSIGTSRIGLATSEDGLHFQKQPAPVLSPENDFMKKYEWNYQKTAGLSPPENCTNCFFDGVEDPRIVSDENGTYIMTYTAYDGRTARLCVASSSNLMNWTKHGLALKGEKYQDLWSKSGAIVAEKIGDQFIAKKINGQYWMYFGDTDIFLAQSDDLINWQICENEESKQKISVLHPRMGYFDSRLVEPGPFALYKDEGILLIYNGSNAANFNDPDLPKFTYAAGQALFDKNSPHKLLDRTENYFIHPDKEYEKVGEVNEVCFVEGLVHFKDQWFLYYGTADSKIAVAVSE